MIDESGQIIDQTEQFVRTTLYSKIKLFEGETPFMNYGSWPVGLLSAFSILYCLIQRRRHH